ncbi:MAG: LysM peptidoglycan-binding domain-containing protein [Pseudomonadota bacterium]
MEPSSGKKRRFRIVASAVVVVFLLGTAVFVHRAYAPTNEPPQVEVAEAAPPDPSVVGQPEADPADASPAVETAPAEEEPSSKMRAPAFDVVRVDADGEGLVAGLAEPGSEVSVLLDGENLAAAPADAAGRFAVFLSLAPSEKTRVMSLLARLDGNEMRSTATVIISPSEMSDPGKQEELVAEAAPVAATAGGIAAGADEEVASLPVASDEKTEPEAAAAMGSGASVQDVGAREPDADDDPGVAVAVKVMEESATPEDTKGADAGDVAAGDALEEAAEDEGALADAGPSVVAPSRPSPTEDASPQLPEIASTSEPAPSLAAEDTPEDERQAASSGGEAATGGDSLIAALEDEASAGRSVAGEAAELDDASRDQGNEDEADAIPAPPSGEATGATEVAERSASDTEEARAPQLLLADEEGITVLQSPEAMTNVALDTISYDEGGDVSLGGRALGSGFVRVYLDDKPITTSRIEANGTWRTGLPEVDSGVYILRVDEVAEDGEVTSRIETPFRREDPDVVAELTAARSESQSGSGADVTAPLQQDVFTVQPGSTLWAIARANYGEGQLYVKVFEANRDRIRDPDLIYPGQVFDIPE